MQYTQGSIGRVFYTRFDHGDDILEQLEFMAKKENIRQAWLQVFGGLASVDVVIGPRKPVAPPEPVWEKVADTREILGTGTLF